jgi:hypothetical protein
VWCVVWCVVCVCGVCACVIECVCVVCVLCVCVCVCVCVVCKRVFVCWGSGNLKSRNGNIPALIKISTDPKTDLDERNALTDLNILDLYCQK